MTEPVLRRAGPEDLEAVEALYQKNYPRLLAADYPPSVMVTAVPLIARAQPQLLASGQFYMIEEAGQALAAGGWTREAPGSGALSPGVAHIRHVATDPGRLREGLARRLVGFLLAEAGADGVREMQCYSTLTAEPFYAAMGFVRQGPMQVELPRGIAFNAVRMTCALR
ncbi:GNAT family N-acetyltransferase [Litorisediminicola beolgyonensis]|uniref:GNAT family N-acetyltransferase n=1 Tax=Litorisediminicola beolgyonensis TaxID=1173614 RepID=A0ABW3ZGY6_9RHOB